MIEAIPNISEGRRAEVVRAAVEAIEAVSGAWVLDWSSDVSHNRSVITIAGDPDPLHAAVLRLFDVALARIDLRRHRGVHPRLGAVDVVPFVPLGGTRWRPASSSRMRPAGAWRSVCGCRSCCTEPLRRRPADAAWSTCGAGSSKGSARSSSNRAGPRTTARGAHTRRPAPRPSARGDRSSRSTSTSRHEISTLPGGFARTVRASGGGLPHVKAMGVLLSAPRQHLVQVSMNLTDYRRTPLSAALERVAREAAREGVEIAGTELVGLVPREAVDGSAGGKPMLDVIRPDQTIEARLERRRPSPPSRRAAP